MVLHRKMIKGENEDPVTNGGAMSHYNAEEVEFDEDRLINFKEQPYQRNT